MEKKPSRRRVQQLHVPVLPDEAVEIKHNAAVCGLSVAAYLRNLGLQYTPKGIMDSNAVIELAKINGDLGRLGGLLKMWLTNDDRLQRLGKARMEQIIQGTLLEIKETQALLFEKAKQI